MSISAIGRKHSEESKEKNRIASANVWHPFINNKDKVAQIMTLAQLL